MDATMFRAWVAEATGLVDLTAWPAGTRLILRRERPHPGAQLRITDVNGHRIAGRGNVVGDPDVILFDVPGVDHEQEVTLAEAIDEQVVDERALRRHQP